MSSSNNDRDPNSSNSNNETGNPFIKFKRFADAQIGSVLQGIIGLPSAILKKPHDAQSRWTDTEDDLKRREDPKQEYTGAEPSNGSHSVVDEDTQIPVKKFRGWTSPASNPIEQAAKQTKMDDEGEKEGIDFYSPVKKSLFAHLSQRPEDHVDWNIRRPGTSVAWDVFGVCAPGNLYRLREDQRTGDALEMVQSMIYNTLNRTASRAECRYFHSDQSLLPYLLFSPYSPLALLSMPPPRKQSSMFEEDEFPYCEAFQDLLLASQGREMTQRVLMPPQNWTPEIHNDELRKARNCVTWINRLYSYGLLSKDPLHTIFGPDAILRTPIQVRFRAQKGLEENLTQEKNMPQDENTESEQDMYNQFLETTSSSATSLTKEIESSVAAAEGLVQDLLQGLGLDTQSNKHKETPPSDGIRKRLDPFDFNAFFHDLSAAAAATRSTATQTDNDASPSSSSSPQSPGDQVISTSTSKKQTALENGMLRTTVVTETVFADGRSSIMETNTIDVPSRTYGKAWAYRDGDGLHRPVMRDDHREGSEIGTGTEEQETHGTRDKDKDKDRNKDKEKDKSKGWFWK